MKFSISTPQGLASLTGATILAASTNANIMATGGYFTSHAALIMALSTGVFAGARVVGSGVSGKIAAMIVIALCSGELFNFSATAERIVVEREVGAAPLKAAAAKRNAAIEKLRLVETGRATSPRLIMASEAKKAADAAYDKELHEGGRCLTICKGLLAKAEAAQIEVTAAATEAQKLHSAAIEAAKADVAANPLPASATPLADRLGVPAWLLDLVVAGLLSFGSNVLAGVLIAFGARSVSSDAGQSDFSVSNDDFRDLRTMVSGELPEPTPPKPRKRKKPETVSASNVISFQQHPVVTALKSNGGSVESNQHLATLMGVSKGEASKRWQEIENQLVLTRHGKQLRIALKA